MTTTIDTFVARNDDFAAHRASVEDVARQFGLTAEQVLGSPYFLVGSVEKITEDLHALRERLGKRNPAIREEDGCEKPFRPDERHDP